MRALHLHRMKAPLPRVLVLLLTTLVPAACTPSATPDTSPVDAGHDTLPGMDAGTGDATPPDASPPPADGGAADAAPRDGGTTDAAVPDAALPDASLPAEDAGQGNAGHGPTVYVPGRAHSPMTPEVVAAMRAVAARDTTLRDNVFAKVGASNTVNTNFLHCFAGTRVDLEGRTELDATRMHFLSAVAGGTTPYDRTSLSATVGWSAWAPLERGTPPFLQQELDAISPRFALVMFGTNDIQARDPVAYADHMLNLVDFMVDRGVIPLLSSIPPRDDDPAADAFVERYNAIARAVAQARLVPFMDLHRALLPLPDHGIGPDGLHMNTYLQNGSARGCVLTADGLRFGFNNRNLLTLDALDRVVRTVVLGQPAPDPAPPPAPGDGSPGSPWVVGAFPFTASGNTATGGHGGVDRYTGCSQANEGGRAFTWRFTLDAPATVRAMVFDRGNVDVDVHLLDATASAEGCVARGHHEVRQALDAGTWHVAVDSYVDGSGTALEGEFLLVLLRE